MAFARLALRSLQQRVPSSNSYSSSWLSPTLSERALSGQRWTPEIAKRFSASPESASDKPSGEKTEVVVADQGERNSKLFPRRQRRRRSLWRNTRNDRFFPSLHGTYSLSLTESIISFKDYLFGILLRSINF